MLVPAETEAAPSFSINNVPFLIHSYQPLCVLFRLFRFRQLADRLISFIVDVFLAAMIIVSAEPALLTMLV